MSVEIVAKPHPFEEAVYTEMPAGLSIAEMLTGANGPVGLPLRVFAGDVLVPQDMLHRVRPKAGTRITVSVVLQNAGGGRSGGGGGGKDTLRTVLTIAVIAVALVAAPVVGGVLGPALSVGVQAGTAIASSALGTAGLLAVNALVPPRGAGGNYSAGSVAGVSGASAAAQQSPNYSITGARNAEQRYRPVPSVLGANRMVPPLGARTYTEIRGGAQYLTMVVVWGYGPLSISDIRIGDTPIGSFQGVEVETREGWPGDAPLSLYPAVETGESLSVQLTNAAGGQSRTTAPETDRISLDIAFPGGVVEFDKKTGRRKLRTVQIGVSYRVHGSGAGFAQVGTVTVTEASTQAIYRDFTFGVPRGQYDVLLWRITADSNDARVQDASVWTGMRSFKHEDPIQFGIPLAKTAIRIRATDQLNSVVDQVNGLVQPKVMSWNGAAWVANQVSSNPGDLVRHVLQGPASAVPEADGDIDLESLAAFSDHCAANGFSFHQIRDFEASVFETLADIAAVGKGIVTRRDGKWAVTIDDAKSLITQHFSPRNSWGFSGSKVFDDTPHAWRVRFVNAAKDYQQDEVLVYADGYTAANATKFEGIEFPGATSYEHVYRLARYHMAVARLRPEVYTLYCDFENLVCTRGDLVCVAHDVPVWSDHPGGRVTQVVVSGGNVVSVQVDEPCELVEGQSYVARFRRADQAAQTVLVNLVTTPGDVTVLRFADTVAEADGPAAGDLFLFGLQGSESVELVVKSIEPIADLAARLTLVDHSPAIHDAHTGAIPEFQSQITRLPRYRLKPSRPTIETIQSDITVAERGSDGTITERIVITAEPASGSDLNQAVLVAQVRLQGADNYGPTVSQGQQDSVSVAGVIGGEVYDIRIRRVASAESEVPGATSEWFELLGYTVTGKTDLPERVTVLYLEGDYAVWDYEPPLDFKGFQLRYHRGRRTTWADAEPAHDGFISETRYDLAGLRGGTFTLLLKAFDTGDRESEDAAVLIVDLGDTIVDNVVLETAYRDHDYFVGTPLATLTGGVLSAGELVANDTVLFWNANPDHAFWRADGATLFWASSYTTMVYETFFVPDPSLGGELSLDLALLGESYQVRYRGNGDAKVWSFDTAKVWSGDDTAKVWSETQSFRAWPGRAPALKRERIYFEVTVVGGPIRPTISRFTLRQDVPDVLERFDDVVVAAGGTRLAPTLAFRRIQNVSLTLQDDGGDAVTAKIIDKNATLGPLIQCFDAAGSAVAGDVDAVIQGY